MGQGSLGGNRAAASIPDREGTVDGKERSSILDCAPRKSATRRNQVAFVRLLSQQPRDGARWAGLGETAGGLPYSWRSEKRRQASGGRGITVMGWARVPARVRGAPLPR